MKLVLLGPILLALSAYSQLAFLESTTICSVSMDQKLCSILPIFSDGCGTSNTIPANLIRFYYAADLKTTAPDTFNTLKYIIARRIQYQLAYNKIGRFVELQLKADRCCKQAKFIIDIKYVRQLSTDLCPTLFYGEPDHNLKCIPITMGLFNALFVNNLLLLRGKSFALLLSSNQFSSQRVNDDQLEWFEKLIEFGMWTGVDIKQESPPEACNCSTMKGFKEWYANCRWFNFIPSTQSRPLYNVSKDLDVVHAENSGTMEQWIILGIVCGLLMMLVGVMINSGTNAHVET